MSGTRALGAGFFVAAAITVHQPAAAQMQPATIPPAELAGVMSAYVESTIELRQFYIACAKDPQNWDREADVLIASLKAAGLDHAAADELRGRLADGNAVAAKYDCAGDIARQRLSNPPPVDWSVQNHGMLSSIGIPIVEVRAEDDPKLVALRAVLAEFVPQETATLNCLALIEPQNFPQHYAEWNSLVDRAQQAILGAGFDAQTVETVVGPARPAKMMESVSDRHAALAACFGDNKWMTWYFTWRWYGLPSAVDKALGIAQ